jgi:hypothetical protein
MAGSTRGTRRMVLAMAPVDDRPEWILTLIQIRSLPVRRTRGRWS